MPPVRLASYRIIAEEIADRLAATRTEADPLAAWSEEVIVPSRGVAEAIATSMLQRLPSGIAGLQLQTLEDLARRSLNAAGQMPRVASPEERRLAMRVAARRFDTPLFSTRGIAAMMERSYRDVRDSGLALDELAQRVRRNAGLRDRQRTETILRAWQEYEKLISKLQAIDPADLLTRAAQVTSGLPPQLLAGFYDMTGAQGALVESLARNGRLTSAWVPTDVGYASRLIAMLRGQSNDAEVVSAPPPSPAILVLECRSRHDELREISARIRQLLDDGVPPSAIAIASRSWEPWEVRLLNRCAAESGFTTTLEEAIPLRAQRIGRGVATLLRLRERGFPRSEVLEVVRSGFRSKRPIDVESIDAAARRARIAGGTPEMLRPLRGRSAGVDRYLDLVEELESCTASFTPEELAAIVSMFRVETDGDLAAAAELDQTGALFRRAAVWGAQAPEDVLDALEQAEIRATPHAGGPRIWAGDVMRFRGRSFRHLFVPCMQDDRFPQRRIEDPLFPDSDRRILGIREIGDGLDEESLLHSILGASASETVTFSYAIGDGFGKALRPSRFLRGLTRVQVTSPPPARPPASPNRLRQLQLVASSGRGTAFDGNVGPLTDALRGRVETLSPTQLEDFGECPQKFFLKYLLGVRDVDDPELEIQINPRDKGSLDHRVLEQFYRKTKPAEITEAAGTLPRLPAALVERLEEIVDRELDTIAEQMPPFNPVVREIERRATRRILQEFLAADIDDLNAQGLTPRWFEYRFGTRHRLPPDQPEPFTIHAAGVPIRVEGTIDRIDEGDRRLRIVDYKSGKALRHQNLEAKLNQGVRLQLALYAMAVAHFFDRPPEEVSGTIKPLVVRDPEPAKFAFKLGASHERLAETLEIFIRSILAGDFRAFANEKDQEFNSCKYCPVNHSCRTRHDADERRALRRFGSPRVMLGGSD